MKLSKFPRFFLKRTKKCLYRTIVSGLIWLDRSLTMNRERFVNKLHCEYFFFLNTCRAPAIPGPSDSIGAPKIYSLEKRILWTQISMLGFLENLKNYQAKLFYFWHFPLGYLKTAQKRSKFQKTPKNDQNHFATSRT